VYNIEEMVCKVKRHGNDDRRLQEVILSWLCDSVHETVCIGETFQLKASNGWRDCSFKDLLVLLKDLLPQGNATPETVDEAK
jgi:hypothetical protein